MPTTLQLRRGTTAENAAFTGAAGELTIDTQTNGLNVHDGSTAGGNAITGGGSSVLTTKGDVATFSTVDARLPVGTNDQVLTADSAEATGVKWADAAGSTIYPPVVTAIQSSDYMLLPHNIGHMGSGYQAETQASDPTIYPAWFYFPTTITSLHFIVGTADAASTDTRVVIYDQDPTTAQPRNVLFDSGHIDVSTTGLKTATLSVPTEFHGCYWFGIKSDSTTVTMARMSVTDGGCTNFPTGVSAQEPQGSFLHLAAGISGAWTTSPALTADTSLTQARVVGYR